MKRTIIILLLFFSITGYSQIKLGYSLDQMNKLFNDLELYDLKNKKYLVRNTPVGSFAYILNDKDSIKQCNFIPNHDSILNSAIDSYNTRFRIIEEGVWVENKYPYTVIKLYYNQKLDYYYFTYTFLHEYTNKTR